MKALFDLRESGNMISCYVAPKTSSPISMDIVTVNKLNNEIVYRYPIIIDGQEQNVNINDNYGKGNITIASETIHDGVKVTLSAATTYMERAAMALASSSTQKKVKLYHATLSNICHLSPM